MSHDSYVTVIHPKAIPTNGGAEMCFLLGPIRNAPPWHEDAIDILVRLATEEKEKIYLRINCPKREEDLVRRSNTSPPPQTIHRSFDRQREWEFETQNPSAQSAGLLFWLPKERFKLFKDKAYGAMTQVELGYWLACASHDKELRIAIGTDGVYNGELHTLMYDIERLAPHLLPMHNSLESLCRQGIAWAKEEYI